MRKGDLLVTTKVDIPAQNQPYRRQASLGGSVSYRNINANEDMSYIVLAKVTKVYYKQGRIDYTLVNRADIVQGIGGNGNGSAPIPLDFFGYQPNGNPYGQYRPIQIGNLITLAFLNGHMSAPIVLGVYPNNPDIYNALSPATYTEGDDRNSDVADDVLACQEVYPSGQLEYRSGSGAILKALNGHSYMAIDDDSIKNNYDELWSTYDKVYDFYRQGTLIEPQKEKAGQWLLVHEDNPLAEDSDNHLTRFYVNPKGEFQIALMNNTFDGNTLLLNGSKDDGFTIEKYYNHDSKADVNGGHGAGHTEEYRLPDYDTAEKYVKLNLGGKDGFRIESSSKAESKEQASSLQVTENGIFINGKALTDVMNTGDQKGSIINDAVKDSPDLKKAIDTAKQAASDASKVGVDARKVSAQVQSNINDMKANMRNYLAQSADEDYKSKSDEEQGKLWAQVFDHAYIKNIKDGGAIHFVADTLEAGTLSGTNMKFENVRFTEGAGNHISANIIDTGELNAGIIKAGTIKADKIDSPELSDITKRLGDIEAGSIKIGKVDSNGNAIDPIKTDIVNESQKVGEFIKPKQAPTPIEIADLNTDYWKQMVGRQVNISADVTVTNYQGTYVNTDGIASGIKIELTDGNNITHTFSGDIDTVHLPIYDPNRDTKDITTKQQITIKVDVPDTITKGISKAYGNLKADKIVIDNLKTNYSNPKYDTAKDAFSVDSDGNVIARSFTAENGLIAGGEIRGNYIHSSHLDIVDSVPYLINNDGSNLTAQTDSKIPVTAILPNGSIYNSQSWYQLTPQNENQYQNDTTSKNRPGFYIRGLVNPYKPFSIDVPYTDKDKDNEFKIISIGSPYNINLIEKPYRIFNLRLYMSLEDINTPLNLIYTQYRNVTVALVKVGTMKEQTSYTYDDLKKNAVAMSDTMEPVYYKHWRNLNFTLDLNNVDESLLTKDQLELVVIIPNESGDEQQKVNSRFNFNEIHYSYSAYFNHLKLENHNFYHDYPIEVLDNSTTIINSDGSFDHTYINRSLDKEASAYEHFEVNRHVSIDNGTIHLDGFDDMGTYNNVTISNQSISFSAQGDPSVIGIVGKDGRLVFNGTNGTNGVWFDSYGNLHIPEGCVFRIFSDQDGGQEVFHVNANTLKTWSKGTE